MHIFESEDDIVLPPGWSSIPEYRAWINMRARCSNPDAHRYDRYGGRGIKVCDEWNGSYGFYDFFAHVGPKPSPAHSLDRINNNGNYEPGNVRWATRKQQRANRG